MAEDRQTELAGYEESERLTRTILSWLNTFPERTGKIIGYEDLLPDCTCMAFSASTTGSSITKRYISGGYEAEYVFAVIYRIKSGASVDEQLGADELLNRLGSWAKTNRPTPAGDITGITIEPESRALVAAVYENGDTDHKIQMKATYEVEKW